MTEDTDPRARLARLRKSADYGTQAQLLRDNPVWTGLIEEIKDVLFTNFTALNPQDNESARDLINQSKALGMIEQAINNAIKRGNFDASALQKIKE